VTPFDKPVALVTGASRGFGRAVAIALAARGLHPVLIARSQSGLEATDDAIRAAGGAATLLPLDLTHGEAVDQIGPSLYQRFGRLDLLVHCAGTLGRLTPLSHLPDAEWRAVVGVNLEAAWRLIRTTEPLLRRAPHPAAVFVTDGMVARPRAYWAAYGASKAALVHLAEAWRAEGSVPRLELVLFDPGPMATALRKAAMPGEDPALLPRPEAAAERLMQELAPRLEAALSRGSG
jgi:NAD(P)-dependent dehydrogenase (short-subunit alcohol dehydrogenase family)